VTARAIGQTPTTVQVQREGDEDRLVVSIRMGQATTTLSAVRVQARSGPGPGAAGAQRPEPGNSERTVGGEQALRLPVDASDPERVAALAPGVLAQRGSDSTAAGFNVAGQRASQNNVTLDGVTFGGAGFPQEAVRGTRVITNTFDVSRGQFSGGQVASTTRGGTNNLYVGSTYSLRDPALQQRPAFAGPYGQGFSQNQLSLGVGGPLRRDRAFYFGALQLQRRSDPLTSLLGADPAALAAQGVAPDSVRAFLARSTPSACRRRSPASPRRRSNDGVNAIARFDVNLGESHTLTVRGDFRRNVQDAQRISPLGVPTTGGDGTNTGGGALASLASRFGGDVFGGALLNEVKVYATRSRNEALPTWPSPADACACRARSATGRWGSPRSASAPTRRSPTRAPPRTSRPPRSSRGSPAAARTA
jgi:hypothetical protein